MTEWTMAMTYMKGKRHLLRGAALFISLAALGVGPVASLAQAAELPAPEREALLARVKEYWAAVHANQRLKSWTYEKQSVDTPDAIQAYVGRASLTVEAVEVGGLTVKGPDEVEVDVKITASFPAIFLKSYVSPIKDKWVRGSDGAWYHVRQESAIYKTN